MNQKNLPEKAVKNRGGRPKGSANKLTRSLANELVRQGCDGLSGMVENMLFWRDKAAELGDLLEEQLKSESPEIRKEALKTMGPFLAARQCHHECSRDVAPYTNPRLNSIEWRGQLDVTETKLIDDKATPQQAQETYAGAIREDNIVPFGKRVAS